MATLATSNKAGEFRVRQTARGVELSRAAVAVGFTTTGDARLLEALQIAGLPEIGDAYPGMAGVELQSISPEDQGDGSVLIRFNYAVPDGSAGGGEGGAYAECEVGAELSQLDTSKDKDGNEITLTYTYPNPCKNDPSLSGQPGDDQPGVVSVDVSEPYIRYSRTETTSPLTLARTYVNKVNAADWNVDPTAPEGTWKCTSITGTSNATGSGWRVTYYFKARYPDWKSQVRYTDMTNGKPVANPEEGTSQKTYMHYEVVDFSPLALPVLGAVPPGFPPGTRPPVG